MISKQRASMIASLTIILLGGAWLVLQPESSLAEDVGDAAVGTPSKENVGQELPDMPNPRPADIPALQTIDSSFYRRTSEFDPGTIRIYIRNTTQEDLSFTQVLLDGLDIPVWGVDLDKEKTDPLPPPELTTHGPFTPPPSSASEPRDDRIVWARLAPPVVRPGQISEFACKLREPMLLPARVALLSKTGETVVVLKPLSQSLIIRAINFDERLDGIYIYVESNSPAPMLMQGIELNGNWIDHGIWFTSRTLAKGDRQCAIIHLDEPLRRGGWITVKVICKGGVIAEERIRVLTGFPINVEEGKPPAGYGFDPEPFACKPAYLQSIEPPKDALRLDSGQLHGNNIFTCAMHAYGGDQRLCAQEILRRYDLSSLLEPSTLCYQHICRASPEAGYALFGELTDAMTTNPNINAGLSQGKKDESPEETVARFALYARIGSQPHPVYPLIHTVPLGHTDGSCGPDELRRRVYTLLGENAKAIIYRRSGWTSDTDDARLMSAQIKQLNAEIGHIRDYLAIADIMPWANSVNRKDLLVRALVAGDKGLVLIIVRKTTALPASREPEPSAGGVDLVELVPPIPPCFTMGAISIVTPGGLTALEPTTEAKSQPGALCVPVPKNAAAYLIKF